MARRIECCATCKWMKVLYQQTDEGVAHRCRLDQMIIPVNRSWDMGCDDWEGKE